MRDRWIERLGYALAGLVLGVLLVCVMSFVVFMPWPVWVALPVGCALVGAVFGHGFLEAVKNALEALADWFS